MNVKLLLCILSVCLIFSCKKKEEEIPDEPVVFTGVKMTDANGAPIGCYGDCDDDWTNFSLTSKELEYLNFTDNVDLTGTGNNASIQNISIYPNPLGNTSNMGFYLVSSGNFKLKITVVNEAEEALVQQAYLIEDTTNNFLLASFLFSNLVRKKIHRLYYAGYTENGTIIFSGYGDFAICTQDGNPDTTTCFE